MSNNNNNLASAVLAAGMGKRIGHHLPKVLYPIVGKPMIYYTLELIEKVPIDEKYIVVGNRVLDVKASLKNQKVHYVHQEIQLGTAHAVDMVIKQLPQEIEELIVFNGDDSAFFEPETIRAFIDSHRSSKSKISFITCFVDVPFGLGRVIRDENGHATRIVEEKSASEEEKAINEVNIGCYIVNKEWAMEAIKSITKSNTGEYYLTDLVYLALKDGSVVNTFLLTDANEWRGVNTQDELKDANERMTVKLTKRKKPTVFIFDIDNTIINTDALKEYVNSSLVDKVIKPDIIESFWNEYESVRNRLGYISIPDLSDSFAQKVNDPSYSEKIRNMFYSIPFESYVYPGIYELIEYIDPKGEIVILTEGDLVYQSMKIKNLRISKYLDEMFVFENKKVNMGNINKIYNGRRIIAIDDKITDLEAFKKVNPDLIALHFKNGVYKDLVPEDGNFKANYVTENVNDLTNFIKKLY